MNTVPITYEGYFILQHKGLNYYAIDLKETDFKKIETIVKGCEAVENECWRAQEDFFGYVKKSDVLSYIEKDGRIIGFDVVTLLIGEDYCIYSNDETMVLGEFRGKNLARNLVVLTLRWLFAQSKRLEGIKKMVPLSISSNPKVVNGYYKNRYATILFDSSFDPSPELISIHKTYLDKYSLSLVHEDYPFCVKNVFPQSNTFDTSNKQYQFSEKVKQHMPEDFDYMRRGDAFSFMVKLSKSSLWLISLVILQLSFGLKLWFNKEIGLLRPKKISWQQQHVRENVKSAERRVAKRRISPMKMLPEGFVERRVFDRRAIV